MADLVAYRDCDFIQNIDVTHADFSVYDLTGYVLTMRVTETAEDDSPALITATTANGDIIYISAALGEIQISIAQADIYALPSKSYVYDITGTLGGAVIRITGGHISVLDGRGD